MKKICVVLYYDNDDYKAILLQIYDIINLPNNPDVADVVSGYVEYHYGEKQKYGFFEIDETIEIKP
jgi:hypothetical protein